MNVNYFNDNNKMLKNNFYYDFFCFLGGIYRNSNEMYRIFAGAQFRKRGRPTNSGCLFLVHS